MPTSFLMEEGETLSFDDTLIASATDHLEVTDALLRFGAGVDRGHAGLLTSAFSDDAVVDFGPCGRKMGLDFPVLNGAETIVYFLIATVQKQTTSHVITNPRVYVDRERAKLRVLVEATHFPKVDPSRRCRMVNWYEADLVKEKRHWRIRRLVIDNVWFDGDPQVLTGKEKP